MNKVVGVLIRLVIWFLFCGISNIVIFYLKDITNMSTLIFYLLLATNNIIYYFILDLVLDKK